MQSNKIKNIAKEVIQFEIKKNIFSDNVIEELSIFKNYPSTLIVDDLMMMH